MRRTRMGLAVAFAVLGAAGTWGATPLVPTDLKKMAEASTVIVRATCVGSLSFQAIDGTIFTLTRMRVTEEIKGHPGPEVLVRTPGGVLPVPGRHDGRARTSIVQGAPQFRPGEESVLFLWRPPKARRRSFDVLGLRHGKLDIETRGSVPAVELSAVGRPGAGRVPLTDLVERIRAAMEDD